MPTIRLTLENLPYYERFIPNAYQTLTRSNKAIWVEIDDEEQYISHQVESLEFKPSPPEPKKEKPKPSKVVQPTAAAKKPQPKPQKVQPNEDSDIDRIEYLINKGLSDGYIRTLVRCEMKKVVQVREKLKGKILRKINQYHYKTGKLIVIFD